MRLEGGQREQIQEALHSAYTNCSELEQMAYFDLDLNLNEVAGNNNLTNCVFQLIRWAETRGRVTDLITAVMKDRPKNPKVQALAQLSFDQDTSPAAAIPSEPSTSNQERSRRRLPLGGAGIATVIVLAAFVSWLSFGNGPNEAIIRILEFVATGSIGTDTQPMDSIGTEESNITPTMPATPPDEATATPEQDPVGEIVVAVSDTMTPTATVTVGASRPLSTTTSAPTPPATSSPTSTDIPAASPTSTPTDTPASEPTTEPTSTPGPTSTGTPTVPPTSTPIDTPLPVPTDMPTLTPTPEHQFIAIQDQDWDEDIFELSNSQIDANLWIVFALSDPLAVGQYREPFYASRLDSVPFQGNKRIWWDNNELDDDGAPVIEAIRTGLCSSESDASIELVAMLFRAWGDVPTDRVTYRPAGKHLIYPFVAKLPADEDWRESVCNPR